MDAIKQAGHRDPSPNTHLYLEVTGEQHLC